MFISKMNRMFHKHGRVAFGLLTLIIIVPFVLYFSAAPSELLGMFDLRSEKGHVTMYGKNLSKDVIQNNIINSLISQTLSGRQVDFERAKDSEDILEMALERYRLLRAANEMGIKVDDIQVAALIRQSPIFQVKGQFNVNMYKMFVTYYLGRYGISENQLEQAVREDLMINMLQGQIMRTAVVTESGAKQYYIDLNKTYDLKVINFKSDNYIDDVKVNDQNLKNYFEKNRAKYLIPTKYKFDVVRFNFIKYKDEATKLVTDKMVDVFYKSSKAQFKGKDEQKSKEEIRDNLIKVNTEKLAKTEAQKFAVKAFGKIEKQAGNNKKVDASVVFNNIAETEKYKVSKVDDWITSKTKTIPRIGKVPEVTSALSRLYMDQPISNAIQGANAYFVICLTSIQPARQADLNEVKEKVTKDFKNKEAVELARSKADAAEKNLNELLSQGKQITDSDYKFTDIPEFSQKNYMPLLQAENGIQVYELGMDILKGKISKPANTKDGAIIVYKADVKLPSEKDFNEKDVIKEYRQFKEWLQWYNYTQMLKTKSNTVIENKK